MDYPWISRKQHDMDVSSLERKVSKAESAMREAINDRDMHNRVINTLQETIKELEQANATT